MPFVEKAIYKLEKEAIPRWNKFLQGYYESSVIVDSVFDQVVQTDFDGGLNLSDKMHERNIRLNQVVRSSTRYFAFNMLDEIVGGYTPQKQKLRQAISIALDIEEYIQIFLNGRGLPAQDLIPPGIFGHQSGPDGINPYIYDWDEVKGEPKRKSLEIARNLLAESGYPGGKDKDGNPLVIHFDSSWRGAVAKARFDWMRKQFTKLNIDLQIRQTDSNRFREKIKTGNYQFLYYGWNADYPDPENFHFLLYGPNSRAKYGGENASNYNNPEFDRLFKQVEVMQNGPKRMALLKQISELIRKDAPWVWGYHPILFGLHHQWYTNTKPMIMGRNALKYQRLNPELRAQKRAEWNRPIWWPVALGAVLLMAGAIPAVITVRNRDRKVDA